MASERITQGEFEVRFMLTAERYKRYLLTNPRVTREQARIELRTMVYEGELPDILTTERYVAKFTDLPVEYRDQDQFLEELWDEIKDRL